MKRLLLIVFTLSGLSCDTSTGLTEPEPPEVPSPSLEIFDGSEVQGNLGFHWLPPIVPGPSSSTGELDTELLHYLSVAICEWNGAECLGDPIRDFSSEESEAGWIQIVEEEGQPPFFQVNWNGSEDGIEAGKIYRIRVMAGPIGFGSADVAVVANMKEAREVDRENFVALVEMRTLPIKFRVEEGALANGGGALVGPGGGTFPILGLGAVLNVPEGALQEEAILSVEELPVERFMASPHWSGVTALQVYGLNPAGIEFERPVELSFDILPLSGQTEAWPFGLRAFLSHATGPFELVDYFFIDDTSNRLSAWVSGFSMLAITTYLPDPYAYTKSFYWDVDELKYFIADDVQGYRWAGSDPSYDKDDVASLVELWEPFQGRFEMLRVFSEADANIVLKTSSSVSGGTAKAGVLTKFGKLEATDQVVIEFESAPNLYYYLTDHMELFEIAHEVGHALGLAHTPFLTSPIPPTSGTPLMWVPDPLCVWLNIGCPPGIPRDQWAITGVDIASLQHLYGEPEKLFQATTDSYPTDSDMDEICHQEFGNSYRLADWDDVTKAVGDGVPKSSILPSGSAFVTRGGEHIWLADRHYIISAEIHYGYLAHDHIPDGPFWLGSWYSDYRILCVREDSSPVSLSGTIYYEKNQDIYRMNLSTLEETPILATTATESDPILSPDGSQIAFSSNQGSSRPQLWIMSADGTSPVRQSNELDYARPTDWIGDRVLISAYEPWGAGGSVWWLSTTGGGLTRAHYQVARDTYSRRGWVDSNWIVVMKSLRYGAAGVELLRVPADGSSSTVLWSNSSVYGTKSGASVSGAGTQVVFDYTTGGSTDLYLYSMSDDSVTPLVGNGSRAIWSPDDQFILFHRDGDLWVTDLAGNETQITDDGQTRWVSTWVQ